jgi:hypothetical protein
MKTTSHGHARANQRGFTADLLDLLAEYGRWNGDRQILDRRAISAFLDKIDVLRCQLLRVLDKGGAAAAFAEDDTLITVFSRRTRHRRAKRSWKHAEDWA